MFEYHYYRHNWQGKTIITNIFPPSFVLKLIRNRMFCSAKSFMWCFECFEHAVAAARFTFTITRPDGPDLDDFFPYDSI